MDIVVHITLQNNRRRLLLRFAFIASALLVLLLAITGCDSFAPQVKSQPLDDKALSELAVTMQKIETTFRGYSIMGNGEIVQAMPDGSFQRFLKKDAQGNLLKDDAGLPIYDPEQVVAIKTQAGITRSGADPDGRSRDAFLEGYFNETTGAYSLAAVNYQAAVRENGNCHPEALYRLSVLAFAGKLSGAGDPLKTGRGYLTQLSTKFKIKIILRQVGGTDPTAPLAILPAQEIAAEGGPATPLDSFEKVASSTGPVFFPMLANTLAVHRMDFLYRSNGGWDAFLHNAMAQFTGIFTVSFGNSTGMVLSLIFLALIIKLITIPFTNASFKGLRDMQRVQPMLKELQAKYKDDMAKFGEEQRKLMKEHNVNPWMGCLPMLAQFPLLYIVYRGVMVYAAGFSQAQFYWVPSLAQPDQILLILYLGSMIVTQKLTTMPSADPAQQQQQMMMTFLMPLMFFMMLSNIASGFVLYWFFLNIFSSVHQYFLMRKFKQDDANRPPLTPAIPAPAGPANAGKSRRK
jgi:YidC/Oxa1 family membrane protein insertase